MFSKLFSAKRRQRRQQFRSSLSIESLERREMLAADLRPNIGVLATNYLNSQPAVVATSQSTTNTPSLNGAAGTSLPTTLPVLGASCQNGLLTVTGTSSADNIYISSVNGTIYVREVVRDLTLLTVPSAQVTSIVVNANGGNDWVNVDDKSIHVMAKMFGGSGDDILLGGSVGDILDGGDGNDRVDGRGGCDTLYGYTGDDLLLGGDDDDVLYGGEGADYMFGGAGNDLLIGEAGDDQMFGEAGNDYIIGGLGKDFIDGGDGDDHLWGGDDADEIYGGEGNDVIYGGAGHDRIRGEGGDDDISGDDGCDLVDGGDGNDVIRGGSGNDALSGGAGVDYVYGGDGNDWLSGDAGNDVLYGDAGNDWLQGGYGIDSLAGGTGDNRLYQDYAPGGEPMGQIGSPISWGDVENAANNTWETIVATAEATGGFLTQIAAWSLDKALAVTMLHVEWVRQVDDRVLRLGDDIIDTLSHYPWEADFWRGVGRITLDQFEILGVGEAISFMLEYDRPWQRGMTSAEIGVAVSVFGTSIDYSLVRFDEHSLTNQIGGILSGEQVGAHVTGYIINSNGNVSNATMIHELVHIWQYAHDGLVYMPEALGAQSGEGYGYASSDDWDDRADALNARHDAGKGLSSYNREQQGDIVMDYYKLRREIIAEEADGGTATLLRSYLEAYLPFVKEVSTLTSEQLRPILVNMNKNAESDAAAKDAALAQFGNTTPTTGSTGGTTKTGTPTGGSTTTKPTTRR